MARRNFWKSFYQGWEGGDRIGERMNTLRQRKALGDAYSVDQETSEEYSPEQITALTDQAEQAGGKWDANEQNYMMPNGERQAPTNTPTFENGAYQTGAGAAVSPTRSYSLGGVRQASQFTPEQVDAYRNQQAAKVYGRFGEPEKAASLRASSQQLKAAQLQIEGAERDAEESKNIQALFKIRQKMGSMSEEDAMGELVKATDAMHKDGVTHGFKPVGNGLYEVTQMRNDRIVGSKVVNFDQAFKESYQYAGPKAYQQMVLNGYKDRELAQGDTRIRNDVDQFGKNFEQKDRQFNQTIDWRTAEHNDDMGYKYDTLEETAKYHNGVIDKYNSPAPMNDLQQAQYEDTIKFREGKNEILSALEAGEITESEAGKRMNFLSRKFGSAPMNVKPALTSADMKNIEETLRQRFGDFDTLPQDRQERLRVELTSQLTGEELPEAPSIDDAMEKAFGGKKPNGLQTPPPKINWWDRNRGSNGAEVENAGPGNIVTMQGSTFYELPGNSSRGLRGELLGLEEAKRLGYVK